MPKNKGQNIKLLYVLEFLYKNTNSENPASLNDIIEMLEQKGIHAERKSLYNDIKILSSLGIDIIRCRAKRYGYYIGSRTFELPEIKLLADLVASSKFITEKKSNILIKKIANLTNIHDAMQVSHQVIVSDRPKTINERIYYSVDTIHSAIAQNKQISFLYFNYNLNKEKVYRHNGEIYKVSPYALNWDNENYYMICNHPRYNAISAFRIDRMENIEILDIESEPYEKDFNFALYAKKQFNMFSGEEDNVTLYFKNNLINTVLDKFGFDVEIVPVNNEWFAVTVPIFISNSFFSWITKFGKDAKIISPDNVRNNFSSFLNSILNQY